MFRSCKTEKSLIKCFTQKCELVVSVVYRGWSGGAMVLGKLLVPGRPTIWMIVGQGPIALVVGASCSRCGWGLFGRFYSPLSFLSSFSLSLGDDPI